MGNIPAVTDIKPHHILAKINNKSKPYKNRDFLFEEYPSGFEDLKILRPDFDYGDIDTYNHLTFKLDNAGVVYVAYCLVGGQTPEWLLGFARHSKTIRVATIQEPYGIYYRVYSDACTVSIPGPAYQVSGSRPPYLVFIGAVEFIHPKQGQ